MAIGLYGDPAGGKGYIQIDGTNAVEVTTSSIKIPSGNTAARPASPTAGSTRFNSELNELEVYNGSAWVTDNGSGAYDAFVLVVGGGGSGGGSEGTPPGDAGGGGGGGGVVVSSVRLVPGKRYNIIVGAGGASVSNSQAGNRGSYSAFGDIVAAGGGAGCGEEQGMNVGSSNGGSGGGAGGNCTGRPGYFTGGRAIDDSQGFGGGSAGDLSCGVRGGAGGGGAGGSGGNCGNTGANGGTGRFVYLVSVDGARYAGGGGGGGGSNGGGSSGGAGGGGNGGAAGTLTGGNGTANTGGGGGAAGASAGTQVTGQGGSGIVVIRYPGAQRFTGGTITTTGGTDTVHTFTSSTSIIA